MNILSHVLKKEDQYKAAIDDLLVEWSSNFNLVNDQIDKVAV